MAIVAKKKVMSLAKEAGISADELVRVLNDAGFNVQSPFSSVDPKALTKVKSELEALRQKKQSKPAAKPVAGGVKRNSKPESDEDKEESGSKKLMGATISLKKAGERKKVNRADRKAEIFGSSTEAKPDKVEAKAEGTPAQDTSKKDIKQATKSLFKEESEGAKGPSPKMEETKQEVEAKSVAQAKAAPEVQAKKEANADDSLSSAVISKDAVMSDKKQELKVKVEAPTQEMADRIAKYAGNNGRPQRGNNPNYRGNNNNNNRGGRGGEGKGYTGTFSTATSGGNNNRGPGGPGSRGGQSGPGQAGGAQRSPGGQNDRRPPRNNAMANAFNQSTAAGAVPGQGPAPIKENTRLGGKQDKGKKKKKFEKVLPEKQINVRQKVSRVMAALSKNPTKKVYRKEQAEGEEQTERRHLKVSDFVTLNELAGLMNVMPNQVMAKCMELGMMVTINHRIDFETIQLVADEFGFDTELMEEYDEEVEEVETEENEASFASRPPVVTVMGHVDHGKTSLLDWVRSERVAASEAGGITQHVGAYVVKTPQGEVTFLDTPGHEAFTAMRARGSQVTDVVVLVVAADDRVMPQTIESIEHAHAAKVPIVVAINKCDRETANPDKIRAQLAEHGVEVEQWGGNVSCIEVSAKTGQGMDQLLETLALETEILQLRANPTAHAKGTVIESKLDKGKGAVATVLIQTGTLRVGDNFVSGIYAGKVRALASTTGERIEEAPPGYPCQIMGLEGAPFSGDKFTVFEDERSAREIANKRSIAAKERELRARRHMTLDQLYDRVKAGSYTELNVIVKADVDGSAEAISNELEKISNKEVKVNVIRKAVGNINESDVMLASASDAIIVAFHLLPAPAVRDLAEKEGVELKQYRIIYEIIEEFRGVVEGMLKPAFKEEVVGEAEILQLFKITKVGWIAGSLVTTGTVDRESQMRIYRNGVEIGTGKVSSLKRHQDDASQVKAGQECGIGISGFEGMKEGDTLAFFKVIEVQRTLKDLEDE